jgi:hypothetical protein
LREPIDGIALEDGTWRARFAIAAMAGKARTLENRKGAAPQFSFLKKCRLKEIIWVGSNVALRIAADRMPCGSEHSLRCGLLYGFSGAAPLRVCKGAGFRNALV